MERLDFDRFFPVHTEPTPESISELLATIGRTSVFAHILVNTLESEAVAYTLVTIGNHSSMPRFSIGGKLKECDYGYIRILGDLTKNLKLKISAWKPWDTVTADELRKSLFDTWSHLDLVTVSSDDERLTGMSIPIKGSEKILLISDLQIEFATGRSRIAPSNPNNDIFWWTHSEFIPRFLRDQVHPFTSIPVLELERWNT